MKPTEDSMWDALESAAKIEARARAAEFDLIEAKAFFRATSPAKAKEKLTDARRELIGIRHSQTAALRHIDAALATVNGEN